MRDVHYNESQAREAAIKETLDCPMENRAWLGNKVKSETPSEIECAARQKILYNIT